VLSIIICTREQDISVPLRTNIESTIGVEHEIVVVSNPNRRYGICEAYNLGASLAKYAHLCFMHDDIEFTTQGWGQHVAELFVSDTRMGLIGLAGGMYKSAEVSGWGAGAKELEPKNVTEVRPATGQEIKHYYQPGANTVTDVVTIDGLWMCCPKAVWQTNRFDADTLSGFHGYDIDFSLQVYQTHRVVVTTAIPVNHHTSGGSFGQEWFEATQAVTQKWQTILPAQTTALTAQKQKQLDWRICRNYFFCAFYYGTKEVSDYYIERCKSLDTASFWAKISLTLHDWLGKKQSLAIQDFSTSVLQRMKNVFTFIG
jgi:Glycosyltransferase like family